MDSDEQQAIGDLRICSEPNGATLSWPMWTTANWNQTAAMRRKARTSFWVITCFISLFAPAVFLWIFFPNIRAIHPIAETWQGRFGYPIFQFSAFLLLVNTAAMFLCTLRGRIHLEIQPASVIVRMRNAAYHLRREFDPRDVRLMLDTLNGIRHFVLTSGEQSVRIGMGLPEDGLLQIAQTMKEVADVSVADAGSNPPARITLEKDSEGAAVRIASLSSSVSWWPNRAVIALIATVMIGVAGTGLNQWAETHDPVFIERQSRISQRIVEARRGFRWIVGAGIGVIAVGGCAVEYMLRRYTAKSGVELDSSAISIERGRRRVSVLRTDATALHVRVDDLGELDMRFVAIAAGGRPISIHPYLTPEEADWLVKWIQSKWPELRIETA